MACFFPCAREPFLAEAHRVASEVVILDAGRPLGVSAEEWQERTLPGGGRYRVFRRHFDADALAAEVGGGGPVRRAVLRASGHCGRARYRTPDVRPQ